jgi:integrase
MAPEFERLIRETPSDRRLGNLFTFLAESGGRLSQARVQKVVAKIGEEAGIQVGGSKTATGYDLRRSIGIRLKFMPQVLQQMMRHSDIQTTMRFYVGLKASDLGEVIYEADADVRPA